MAKTGFPEMEPKIQEKLFFKKKSVDITFNRATLLSLSL